MLIKFVRNETGQDMIEYGLLASIISIVAVVTIRLLGPLIIAMYQAVHAALI